jgi:hypothetical protein
MRMVRCGLCTCGLSIVGCLCSVVVGTTSTATETSGRTSTILSKLKRLRTDGTAAYSDTKTHVLYHRAVVIGVATLASDLS